MNLKFYLEKLHASEEYKKFILENPEAYLCSGFFVIDKEGNDNKQHLDYYVPDKKQIFSFQLENMSSAPKGVPSVKGDINTEGIPVEAIDDKVLERVLEDCDFDLEKVERMILNEMIYKGIQKKTQKILLSLQNKKGKDFLIGTVFISALGMLKIKIALPEMKIIEFEKKSFFDILRKK